MLPSLRRTRTYPRRGRHRGPGPSRPPPEGSIYRKAIAIAAFAAVLIAAPASAHHSYTPDAKLFPDKAERYGVGLTERYLRLWQKVGPAQAGNNLVIDGAPKDQVAESADRLDRWLHPPAPAPVAEVATTAAPVTTSSSSYSGGSYSIPSDIVACESGGDYGAVNPSSGAYGAYQILPSTASAYGCDLSSPAGQDACAGEIYADVGSSAWVC